ncbi:biotin/lipoyl-binding protein [Rhodopirellula sp. JC639]|uniref:biotin/lipoyl-binding protein n=1 Tax=Stieleria mannarensis TaxID=2755585 RepID=UPI00160385C7|nr:biotin/lipoyl-binding protein [Rhodopirellula sp. JC639]
MPDDPWDRCADVIARLEDRLKSPIDGELFPQTADDLMQRLSAIAAVAIFFPADQPICRRGQPLARDPDLQSQPPVTETSSLTIHLWLRSSPPTEPATRQAIEEALPAIGSLLVAAVARIGLSQSQHELDSLTHLSAELFADGDADTRLHRIAAELARTMRVDRLSLLRRSGAHYEMIGSSVQARFDRRADQVWRTQNVARAIDQTLDDHPGLVVTLGHDDGDAIESFLKTGNATQLHATRLGADQILVIGERFEATSRDTTMRDSRDLSPLRRQLFDTALADVLRRQGQNAWDRCRAIWRKPAARWRLAAGVALLLVLCLYPITIRVAADGRIVPQTQTVVHAPVNGQIERLACESGMEVTRGQVLCEFSSHDLELEITRLGGELITVEEQLQIAATRRGDESGQDVGSDRRVLEARRDGLGRQITLLEKRRDELVVHSPVAGTVTLLMSDDDLGGLQTPRPVQRGDAVIRVINPADGYRVELDVPDREVGYVLAAIERQAVDPVECRFRLRSQPQRQRQGTLLGLAPSASLDRFGRLVVAASIQPNEHDTMFSADAGVVGWIDCNSAAAGFVLSRKVIEQLRLWGWL